MQIFTCKILNKDGSEEFKDVPADNRKDAAKKAKTVMKFVWLKSAK